MSREEVYLFNEGSHFYLYRKLGAHPVIRDGIAGTWFSVWAPNAERVSVVGPFNDWKKDAHPLGRRGDSGIWEVFLPGVGKGTLYKLHRIVFGANGFLLTPGCLNPLRTNGGPLPRHVVWQPQR